MVSYSEWKSSFPRELSVDPSNFLILFESKFPYRLKKLTKEFFRAYFLAAKESLSQDKFPSLAQIKSRMSRGDIYNFKSRILDKTCFFLQMEDKPRGTVLIPAAHCFRDSQGIFSELAFDFQEEIKLPRINSGKINMVKQLLELRAETKPLVSPSWREIFQLRRPWHYLMILILLGINVGLLILLLSLIIRAGF